MRGVYDLPVRALPHPNDAMDDHLAHAIACSRILFDSFVENPRKSIASYSSDFNYILGLTTDRVDIIHTLSRQLERILESLPRLDSDRLKSFHDHSFMNGRKVVLKAVAALSHSREITKLYDII